MASEVLVTFTRDEIDRAYRRSAEKYELDTQSMLTNAKRQGRQEGIQEGIEQGMVKGMQKGNQEGRKEASREIINLLKSGKSPEEIIRDYDTQ